MTGLHAQVRVDRGSFTLDVAFTADVGEIVVVLGPNGAGKSTLLRALAGLTPLTAGQVVVHGEVLDDVDGGIHRLPEQRPAGVVFQDYLLFPHLSARDNVAFGLRSRGVKRSTARARADDLLARFAVAEVADAKPARLSGGQAQRVALARALAVDPQLLLLDEPMAALDVQTRVAVRSELRRHLNEFGGISVLVTHDPMDALVLGHRVVVVEQGRVVQAGRPGEIARRPRTDYVARLMGRNLLAGTADGRRIVLTSGGTLVAAHDHRGPVFVAIRPAAIALFPEEPKGSPRNVWPAVVREVDVRGDDVRLSLAGPPDVLVDVTLDAVADLSLEIGSRVWCAAKATDLEVYSALGERG